jgi:hypothetical protein
MGSAGAGERRRPVQTKVATHVLCARAKKTTSKTRDLISLPKYYAKRESDSSPVRAPKYRSGRRERRGIFPDAADLKKNC